MSQPPDSITVDFSLADVPAACRDDFACSGPEACEALVGTCLRQLYLHTHTAVAGQRLGTSPICRKSLPVCTYTAVFSHPAWHSLGTHLVKHSVVSTAAVASVLQQNHLMKICIPISLATKAPGYNPHGWALKPADVPTPYTTSLDFPVTGNSSYSAYPAAGRKLLAGSAAVPAATASPTNSSSKNGTYDKAASAKATDAVCGAGWTQLFPAEAIHGIHIFIALTALVHVFYAIVCLSLCTLRVCVRAWACCSGDVSARQASSCDSASAHTAIACKRSCSMQSESKSRAIASEALTA